MSANYHESGNGVPRPWRARVSLFAILVAVLVLGLWLRRATWETTRTVRFVPDLSAAWHWGRRSAQEGYWNLYDSVIRESADGNYVLDYVPLRLAVCEFWVRTSGGPDRRPAVWPPDWSSAGGLLLVHTLMEIAAAAGAFFLVRHWLLWCKPSRASEAALWVNLAAAAAAAAIWLNPAVAINSHGRPGTDVWILPFYIWAILAASSGRWLVAGLVAATGAMFKGQQFIVAPFFLLWPLFQRRPARAAAWLAGGLLGVALWTAPWSLSLTGPLGRQWNVWAFLWSLSFSAVAWGLTRGVRREYRGSLRAGLVGLGILLCIALFDAGAPWFRVGAGYGATKYGHDLCVGGAMCLAGILEEAGGWSAGDAVLSLAGGGLTLTMRHALFTLYALALVLTSALVARLHGNKNKRFLVAIALPWLVWFAFAAQIHERYLLFGAALGGIAIAVHAGAFAMALVLSATSFLMTLVNMLAAAGRNGHFLEGAFGPDFGARLQRFMAEMYPGFGWVVILVTCVVFYICAKRDPDRTTGQASVPSMG